MDPPGRSTCSSASRRRSKIREYRETFFKPYRIVYHIDDARVFISLIADGRRDMRSLLARRLLAG